MNIFLKFVSLFILLTFSPNASSSNLTQEKKESNISYNYYPYSTFTKNHLIYPVRHYSDKVSTKQVSPFTKLRNLQDSTEDNSSTEEINTNTGSTGGETTTPTNSEDSSQSESQTPTSTGNSNPCTESTTTPSEDGSTTTPTKGTSSTPSNSESDSTNPPTDTEGSTPSSTTNSTDTEGSTSSPSSSEGGSTESPETGDNTSTESSSEGTQQKDKGFSFVDSSDNNFSMISSNRSEMRDNIDDNILDCLSQNKTIMGEDYIFNVAYSNPTNTNTSQASLDLSACETLLRAENNISDTESLIVLTMELNRSSSRTNQVEYAIYTEDGTKLDLTICSTVKVSVSYPLTNTTGIDLDKGKEFHEMGFDVYDPTDAFFNDICSTYSVDGLDVPLKDRRNDFYQNATFCESGCTYEGINFTTSNVICNCTVKTDISTDEAETQRRLSLIVCYL